MTDPHKPLAPASKQPDEIASDIPEPDQPIEIPATEGPLPGLPPVTDPLLQPTPHPNSRKVPPLD